MQSSKEFNGDWPECGELSKSNIYISTCKCFREYMGFKKRTQCYLCHLKETKGKTK